MGHWLETRLLWEQTVNMIRLPGLRRCLSMSSKSLLYLEVSVSHSCCFDLLGSPAVPQRLLQSTSVYWLMHYSPGFIFISTILKPEQRRLSLVKPISLLKSPDLQTRPSAFSSKYLNFFPNSGPNALLYRSVFFWPYLPFVQVGANTLSSHIWSVVLWLSMWKSQICSSVHSAGGLMLTR